MKRFLLRLLAAALLLPLLGVAAFYGYENWAGGVAWKKAEALLKAAGEPMSLEDLQPRPVPDAENMAAAPIFREIFTFHSPRRAEVYALHLPPPVRSTPEGVGLTGLARRFHADFSGDTDAAAQVILEGLAPLEPLVEAIRRAARRPESVWPLTYDRAGAVPTPFLPPLRQAVEVLAARGTVALAENDPATALAEFELIVRLARDANQPALLVTCMAEQGMLAHALNIVRDGLALDAWSDTDLARIEAALNRVDLVESFARSVRGERALFLASPELANAKAEMLFRFIDFRSPASEWITTTLCRAAWDLRPSGWLAMDRASYASFTQDWLDAVLRKGCVRPWALQEWNARLRAMRRDPGAFFRTPVTAFALATFTPVARMAAYTQSRVDFVRLACAIELHRRQTGQLPPELALLAPAHLVEVPRDPMGGSPYAYQRRAGDEYVLYGLGWNAKYDGGSGANANSFLGPSTADDWVWKPAPRPQRAAQRAR